MFPLNHFLESAEVMRKELIKSRCMYIWPSLREGAILVYDDGEAENWAGRQVMSDEIVSWLGVFRLGTSRWWLEISFTTSRHTEAAFKSFTITRCAQNF